MPSKPRTSASARQVLWQALPAQLEAGTGSTGPWSQRRTQLWAGWELLDPSAGRLPARCQRDARVVADNLVPSMAAENYLEVAI
jgi:hypothetical protein